MSKFSIIATLAVAEIISTVKAEEEVTKPPVVSDDDSGLIGVYIALGCVFFVSLLWIINWCKIRTKQMKAHEESKKIFLTRMDQNAKKG